MSLAFMHNPDWLSTEQLHLLFEDVSPNARVVPGGYSLGGTTMCFTGVSAGLIRKAISFEEKRYFYMGCRLRVIAPPQNKYVVLAVTDAVHTVQCCVALREDMTLAIHRGTSVNDDPLRWGVTYPLEQDQWYRLGFRGYLDFVGGKAGIFLNNEPAVEVDEIPTLADDGWDSQGGICIGVGPEFLVGHVYMIDAGLPGHADLLHDLYVHPEYPVETLAVNTFSPQGAPTVHEATDDPSANDGDLTAATGNNKYAVGLSIVDARVNRIYGTRLNTVIKTINAPYLSARFCTIIDGKTYASTTRRGVQPDSYQISADAVELNPATGSAWRREDLNVAGAGFIVESGGGPG